MVAMNPNTRENLTELLRRFMDDSTAQATQADIEAAERILDDHPAPTPSCETLNTVRILTLAAVARKRHRIQIFRGAVAAAAAIILTVMIGRQNPVPMTDPKVGLASILPTAIWESHDIAADDLDLVYFASEIRHIDAEIRALDSPETQVRRTDALRELEMELVAIETEYWKGSY